MAGTRTSLKTLITQLPKIINDNLDYTDREMAVFYDKDLGILIKPINTTGRVKGTTGEFVNVIVDNLTVKSQFTNLYSNSTTIDSDFVTAYNEGDTSTRIATGDTSTNVIWPLEPSGYSYIDLESPYIKINNDGSIGLQNNNIGQEVRLLLNSNGSATKFAVLLDVSEGGTSEIVIDLDGVTGEGIQNNWVKLITTAWDASYGPTWVVKEAYGSYNIV